MTASLQCPTCSAPLDPPAPHTRAMRCPYCGASAVLTERLGHVEASASKDQLTENVAEVVRLLRAGIKIGAIKVYRERFGGGLKEAKDAVERIEAGQSADGQPANAPVTSSPARSRGGIGCAVVGALIAVLVGVFALRQGAEPTSESGPIAIPEQAVPEMIPGPGGESASLALAKPVLRFGSEGTGAGRFTDARSVAVDGTGRVYVGEYQGGRVQVFDSLGRFLTQWRADPEMPLLDLAADRGGIVYVVQSGRIKRYEGATGAPLSEFRPSNTSDSYSDIAVALDGSLYAVAGRSQIVHLSREGEVLQTLDIHEAVHDEATPARVAVSGTDDLYVLDQWSSEIYHLDPNGRFVDRFGGKGDRPDNLSSPSDMAFDGRGRLYVSDLGHGIRVFDAGGHYLDTIGGGVVFGLAFNDRDELYAAFRNDNVVVKYRLPR